MSLLYTTYAPKMRLLIQRYVSSPDDVQDILHDGFVLALTRLNTLHNPERLDYWLATIMRNLCIKFLQAPDMQQILSELPDTEDLNGVEDLMDFDAIISLIDTLPEGYQNVFRLAVLENKSHKEIAGILGIAPNSSSSQLFRAKLQLRDLITNYRKQIGLLSLLLLTSSAGVFLILQDQNPTLSYQDLSLSSSFPSSISTKLGMLSTPLPAITPQPTVSGKSKITKSSAKRITSKEKKVSGANEEAQHVKQAEISHIEDTSDPILTADNSTKDNTSTISIESISIEMDSIKNPTEQNERINMEDLMAIEDYPLPVIEKTEDNNWTFALSLSTGNAEFGSNKSDFASDSSSADPSIPNIPDNPFPDKPGQDVSFGGDGNGEDDKDDTADDSTQNDMGKVARRGKSTAKPLKDQSHHNHQPISFSFTAQKRINSWLGIETGLSYTYLHTTFEDENRVTECHWHYLGIPLKVNFTAVKAGRFSFYGSVGGSIYIPVYSGASLDSGKAPLPGLSADGRFGSKPVWAAGVGIGVSFSLTDQISLYFEPTAQRYFTRKVSVPNLWSDEPWGLTFPIGIRFNW